MAWTVYPLKNHYSSYLELAVIFAEALLLIAFSIPLYSDRVDKLPPESEAVVVRVVAEQFAWNIHYPGADNVFGKTELQKIDLQSNPLGLDFSDPAAKDDIVAVNQLHIPVAKPVIIHLSSKDVIHSFAIPQMRVKQDAIHGMEVPVWFTPTVTTAQMRVKLAQPEFDFQIACAQLCGNGHSGMKGFVTVESPDEFAQWLQSQAPSAGDAAAGDDDSFWQ